MFDYPPDRAHTRPELGSVFILAEDAPIEAADEKGADIKGPEALCYEVDQGGWRP